MKTLRSAFTLVEILISVMILSGAIVYVLKLHSQSREQIIYVSQHNKHTLEDSLFLSKNIFRYHKSKKSAYDLLPKSLKPRHFQSRDILKKLERNIYIPEPINLLSKEEEETQNLSAAAEEIKLKGNYSSYFLGSTCIFRGISYYYLIALECFSNTIEFVMGLAIFSEH